MAVNGGEMSDNAAKLKILNLISADPKISATALARTLSLGKRTVERYIKELRDEGKLMRRGSARGGYWKIN